MNIGIDEIKDREEFGSYAAVAAICGVTREAVRNWKQIPPQHCITIEEATGGKVTRYELRPDVFGPAPMQSVEAAEKAA
jgi:DNA-binding transcriptional regulator YdaS (Cro superfamily)